MSCLADTINAQRLILRLASIVVSGHNDQKAGSSDVSNLDPVLDDDVEFTWPSSPFQLLLQSYIHFNMLQHTEVSIVQITAPITHKHDPETPCISHHAIGSETIGEDDHSGGGRGAPG